MQEGRCPEATPFGAKLSCCSVRRQFPYPPNEVESGRRIAGARENRWQRRLPRGVRLAAGFGTALSEGTAGCEAPGNVLLWLPPVGPHLQPEPGADERPQLRMGKSLSTQSCAIKKTDCCEDLGSLVLCETNFFNLDLGVCGCRRRASLSLQRSTTVRRGIQLGNSECMTKTSPEFHCAFTDSSNKRAAAEDFQLRDC